MVSSVSGRKEINYLDGWANSETLSPLNLMYDATPSRNTFRLHINDHC
ncbi:hypothetical protein CASFOL_010945 [Castilleja foliolosa]|uniref:Uncharacterized protein n=1 Tax=Castilleja foliolosa TaxID=1961234 RepID=A0ABD3DU21_9LAMI